jgi:putative acetyltransferase
MSFTLRPIRPGDDEAVARIIRTVMPDFGASGPGFALHDPEVSAMSDAYARPRCGYLVLVDDETGAVVGGGGYAPLAGGDPSVCELKKMYFLPSARGHGQGERLLRALLDAMKGAGFARCYLETLTGMDRAMKLYEKLGFQRRATACGATGHFGCDTFYDRDL